VEFAREPFEELDALSADDRALWSSNGLRSIGRVAAQD
jgi:hypothetical protein